MARYFFNFRNGDEFVDDLEGYDLPGVEAAIVRGTKALRDILSQDVQAGTLHTGAFIEIEDANHQPVDRIELLDVIDIQ